MRWALALAPLVSVVACSNRGAEPAPARPEASAPKQEGFVDAGDAGKPTVQEVVDASIGAVDAAPPAASSASTPEPPPKVKVVTIGMHVGGGPYDEPTKEPMKKSVEPHFADLARCWRHVPQPKQADAGVDLVIEAKGGKAQVSNPRATIEGEGFKPCIVAFFEGIDFLPPKNGKTTVSYSVRFFPR